MINLTDTDVLVAAVTVLGAVAWWVSRDDNQAETTNPAVAATGAFVRSGKAFQWGVAAIAGSCTGLALYKAALAYLIGGWMLMWITAGMSLIYLAFGLPVTLLMLARQHDGAAILGTVFCALNALTI